MSAWDINIYELNEVTRNHIELLPLNVCGLSNSKLDGDIFGSYFKKYDIILLQETWSAEGDDYLLDGYVFHNFPWKNRHKLSLRNSGGLAIFVNYRIAKGVTIIKHHEDCLVWLKLEKKFFGFTNDLYVANVYIVP